MTANLQNNPELMRQIPAIPDVARSCINLHSQRHISQADISAIQNMSPEFFAQLLAVLNSDHFNLTTKVENIKQAIDLSGFERVCNLMLCLSVQRTLSKLNIEGVDQQLFWEDSLRRAVSARMIGELIGLDGSRCFAAGFMQDVGFLLLFLLYPDKAGLWHEFRKREPEARYIMEHNVFGNSHDQIMAAFCEKWGLLENITVPLLHHHTCAKDDLQPLDNQLCKILYCADWMASVYTSTDKSFVINKCRRIITDSFQMEAFRTEELLAAIPDEVDITARVMGIKLSSRIEFSQVLFDANIKLSEDNSNFQELTHKLEQALQERDRLASELNRELGLAREIQKSLLPPQMTESFPLCGINISARDLSGDFYDYFTLPDGRIYFTLGDVSGKGVNAALLMAKTSSLFRCLGKRIHSPGELLKQINLELCETSIHGMFVTMIAGIYCPDSRWLKLVNAGNPPALIISREGLAREIEARSPPLGVVIESEFPELEYNLGDDSLYMFSDGITEGFIAEKTTMGLSGLFKSIINLPENLPPEQRIRRLVSCFRAGDVALRDDVTLLLLEHQAH
ncbi:MAG: HDOD domain-containing protein [Gammaproteobacteria bacterium]|nr:HDOD domain-containing protein [Gammaproteobacteria bacterium]